HAVAGRAAGGDRLGDRQPAQRRGLAGRAELQPHVRIPGDGGLGVRVIKLGGSLLEDAPRRAEVLRGIAKAWKGGEQLVRVHGGRVRKSDPTLIRSRIEAGFLPIVSSVAAGARGTLLNVNADTAAAAIAVGLNATSLVFLTDVAGLLDGNGEVVPSLHAKAARA